MRRFIETKLARWKEKKRRKPLVIRGARQVGKTWIIKQFGKTHFDITAVVDLEKQSQWHRLFQGNIDIKQIVSELEILTGQRIIPGKTLLFFDEIQACPRALTALRYFLEELPELHVIAAGSLLEFALREISFPVGRLQFMHLSPLNFAEFLLANGDEETASVILDKPKPTSPTVHEHILGKLRQYLFVGGMPESVKAFMDTGSLRESFDVQSELYETYRLDFAKYRPQADRHCLDLVLTATARSVGQQIKYSKLADAFSHTTLKKAFNLLGLANVVRRIPSVDPSGLPLEASASRKIFKAVMVDIGLLRYLSGMPIDIEFRESDLLTLYHGAMAEQFVGQEIISAQELPALHYWSRRKKSSSAEVDYVTVISGKVFPVEVKSGPAGRLRSLHLFLNTYSNSPRGIVLSTRRYAELPEQKIIFLPLYFAYSLNKL